MSSFCDPEIWLVLTYNRHILKGKDGKVLSTRNVGPGM